jgi:predicted GTPase/ABC-type transporter Mla MlaB component
MADRIALKQLLADVELLNTDATRKLLYIDDSLINRPETTRAYIERHHQWARLLEVVSSIPRLVGQGNTVPLVGFLGHFSSGKSSLINALLGIGRNEHPHFKRETGEHPTDKGIMLTTHFEHFNDVRRRFPSTLANIAVIQGPALPLLEHMTLVDTPGLGDNAAEMELVIQFLHLVHVLVLPVHGRQPFADSDKAFALLNLTFKDLAGVPKIFVVTNADHFLNDRHGDFETDWNQAAADKFWRDTLTRLNSDSRFQAHREALTTTEPIFVDSVDGFQIDRLRDTLLPIVRDNAQRARTDAARTGYVFRCAAAALRHLEHYISERSRHLAALRQQAEERSQNTETAIEDLVRDLGLRLNDKSQRLPVDPQQLATLNDPLAQIITVQTIQQSLNINQYLSQFQAKLNSCARLRLNQVMRRALATYEQRRANPQARYQSEVLTPDDVERVVNESGLHGAMKKCAQLEAQVAISKYKERLQSGLGVLDTALDQFRVNDVLRDFKDEIEKFERKHDDSVKGLFAYVTQPTSKELLREHGFVTFDDAGNRRVDPEDIAVFDLEEYVNIENAVDRCKNALREIRQLTATSADLTDRGDSATGDNAVSEKLGSTFESTAMKPVTAYVTQQVSIAVSSYDNVMQVAIDNVLNTTRDRESEQVARIQSIWTARRQLAVRFLIMAVFLGGIAFALKQYAPDTLAKFLDTIPKSVIYDAMVNIIASLVVLVIAGLITLGWTGFSNPAAKAAFSSTISLRLRTWWQRRNQLRQLRKIAIEALRTLTNGIGHLDTACLSAITQWIQTQNAEFIEVHGRLAKAREQVNQRARNIGDLVTTISPWITNLPKRLLERSKSIREDAIAEHMATIREAADSVETLRSTIVRIAENAEVSAP